MFQSVNFGFGGDPYNWSNTSVQQQRVAVPRTVAPAQPAGLQELLQALLALTQQMGLGINTGVSAPKQAQTTFAPPVQQRNGRITIAQIDNFGNGHGQRVANTLRSGGTDPSLNGQVDLLQYNIAGRESAGSVSGALGDIIFQVRQGRQIDAVNISLQDFSSSRDAQTVRQQIDMLSAMGVPVIIAAGNDPTKENMLATQNSFEVESTTNGRRNFSSSNGNIRAEAGTTSFAAAAIAPLIAARRASGMSIAQIKNEVQNSGGTLF